VSRREFVDAAGVADMLGVDPDQVLRLYYGGNGSRASLPGARLHDPRKLWWRRADVERRQLEGNLPRRRGEQVQQAEDGRDVNEPRKRPRKQGRQHGR
jgi:hypothetical protein